VQSFGKRLNAVLEPCRSSAPLSKKILSAAGYSGFAALPPAPAFLCNDVPMNLSSISILLAEPDHANRIPYAHSSHSLIFLKKGGLPKRDETKSSSSPCGMPVIGIKL
jgi:hypothetical protein